jgi:F-type H+-transporting ATPase subunit epsilon
MILRIYTPTEVVLEQEVAHVTLEDPTGSLGIRPGHAPLVTPLVPSILVARDAGGHERYVAVNGGVAVVNADALDVVARQAVESDDLDDLEDNVLTRFELEEQEDKANFVAFEKMRLSFMRRLLEYERAE